MNPDGTPECKKELPGGSGAIYINDAVTIRRPRRMALAAIPINAKTCYLTLTSAVAAHNPDVILRAFVIGVNFSI
jgi:hypothetical protein